MSFTQFAVAGTGGIGLFFIKALHNVKNVKLRVLTRKESTAPEGIPSKVQLIPVDYSSASDLEKALDGVEIVISALSGGGFAVQPAVAKAAKQVGAKHFVPSEYGNDTSELTDGPLFRKTQFQRYLKQIDLPFTTVFNGLFADIVLGKGIGFDWENKQAKITEPGDAPVSFTPRHDIARFVAHYFSTTNPSDLVQTLRIEGDRKSFDEVVMVYEKIHNTKVAIEYEPQQSLEKRLHENPDDFLAYLRLEWAQGRGTVGEENGSKLWPEWKPSSVEDVLKGEV